jgi:hypothetical protein
MILFLLKMRLHVETVKIQSQHFEICQVHGPSGSGAPGFSLKTWRMVRTIALSEN